MIEEHSIEVLFEQLGLDSDETAVDQFIEQHALPQNIALDKADFWNQHQANFLREVIEDDAEWALIVDTLSILLRHN
ncbi:MAG: DUF2789 family protein [Cellvibrionales bacterium]|nr:DUF2789 family protein [Cellvibrionales bacterium]